MPLQQGAAPEREHRQELRDAADELARTTLEAYKANVDLIAAKRRLENAVLRSFLAGGGDR